MPLSLPVKGALMATKKSTSQELSSASAVFKSEDLKSKVKGWGASG